MANSNINVHIIARENLFHPCKIGRAPYGVRLISYNAGRAPYNVQTGIGLCYQMSGARAIIKFAGDVHIAEILRCQFYF